MFTGLKRLYYWFVTALLILGPIALLSFALYSPSDDLLFCLLASLFVWPLAASVLLIPIKTEILGDHVFREARANGLGAMQAKAKAYEHVATLCNCPNFIVNLGLPHVSDCPRFGEPRRR